MCYFPSIVDKNIKDNLVFYGFCSCGCGGLIFQEKLCPSDLKSRGEKRFLKGHRYKGKKRPVEHFFKHKSLCGEKSHSWKGGSHLDGYGYVLIMKKDHPNADCNGYVKQHRLVMEQKLGRFLLPEEVVHHINGVRNDNRVENIKLLANIGKHNSLHKNKLSEEGVKRVKQLVSSGEKQTDIAKMFGVSSSCIFHIKNGETWKYIK